MGKELLPASCTIAAVIAHVTASYSFHKLRTKRAMAVAKSAESDEDCTHGAMGKLESSLTPFLLSNNMVHQASTLSLFTKVVFNTSELPN